MKSRNVWTPLNPTAPAIQDRIGPYGAPTLYGDEIKENTRHRTRSRFRAMMPIVRYRDNPKPVICKPHPCSVITSRAMRICQCEGHPDTVQYEGVLRDHTQAVRRALEQISKHERTRQAPIRIRTTVLANTDPQVQPTPLITRAGAKPHLKSEPGVPEFLEDSDAEDANPELLFPNIIRMPRRNANDPVEPELPDDDTDTLRCSGCGDRAATTVFVPCGHPMYCVECAYKALRLDKARRERGYQVCHMCKTTIEGVIKVYGRFKDLKNETTL